MTVILEALFYGPGRFPQLNVRLVRGFSYEEILQRIEAGDWCLLIENGREDPTIDAILDEMPGPRLPYVDFSNFSVLSFKMEAGGMGFDLEFDRGVAPNGGKTLSRIIDLHTGKTVWRRDYLKNEVPEFAEVLP